MLSEHGKRRSVRPHLPQGEKDSGGAGAFRATGFMAKSAEGMNVAAP